MSVEENATNRNKLFSDKPLTHPSDDRLNHSRFASALADSIIEMSPDDGFVVALYGAWGSGKSTLIEFVLHYLKSKDQDKRPLVIRFNPWWFTGQENLARHFFDQLYSRFASKFGKGVKALTRSVRTLGQLVAESPVPSSGIAKVAGSWIPNLDTRDVIKVKQDISRILTRKKRRVLIVIDDIDRLSAEEIRQLFALIKAVADFPNTIYLLAFDRDVVAEALSSEYNSRGDAFLEKIVQVSFEVPSISAQVLRALFLERVESLVGEIPSRLYRVDFMAERGFLLTIQALFTTPRDIFRLINTISVTYPAVAGEVDAADFIAIEALRVFRPTLYDIVRRNRTIFTSGIASDEIGNNVKQLLEGETQSVRELVTELFPALYHQSPMFRTYDATLMRKELRVSSPVVFDVYFRFSFSSNDVSRTEMLNLLNAATSSHEFRKAFEQAVDFSPDKTRKVLKRFPEILDQTTAMQAEVLIATMLEIGDRVIALDDAHNSRPGYLEPIGGELIEVIASWMIRIPIEERASVLVRLIPESAAIELCSHLFLWLGSRQGLFYESNHLSSEGAEVLRLEDVLALQPIVVAKINNALEALSDSSSNRFRILLHAWGKIDKMAAKSWVRKALEGRPKILDFVDGFVVFRGTVVARVNESLWQWFDQNELRISVTELLNAGTLSEHQKYVAETFLKITST